MTSTANCKIWLETTNGSDNLVYAKMMSSPGSQPQGDYLDPLYKMFEEAIKTGSEDAICWDKGDAIPNLYRIFTELRIKIKAVGLL